MDDEKTTEISSGDEPNESSATVESMPSVGEADNPAGVSPAAEELPQPLAQTEAESVAPVIAEVKKPTSTEPRQYENYHDTPHPHFKWHAEVRVDGHDVYQGYVKDISMKGVHLYLDHNLQNAKFVKLHIQVPPLDVKEPHHILEVTGKISATVYDSDEDSFRSAINFLEFTLASDRVYLQSRLSQN